MLGIRHAKTMLFNSTVIIFKMALSALFEFDVKIVHINKGNKLLMRIKET